MEIEKNDLNELCKILNIEVIPNDTNYWLIRTSSGDFFDDFYTNNYVAIGWNELSDINYIRNAKDEDFKEYVKSIYPEEEKPGYIANQVKRFLFEIKKDDIILIPSINSEYIAFGKVTSESAYIRNIPQKNLELNYPQCDFLKSINVSWIKLVRRNEFDPYLYKLMSAHSTISNVYKYESHINRILYPVYIKNDFIHTTYNVINTEDIPANTLITFLTTVLNSVDIFNKITNNSIEKSSINIKLNVQSPGPIEFIGYAMGGGLIVAFTTLFLFGAKFDVELFKVFKLNVDTKGLLGSILEFVKEHNNKNSTIQQYKNSYKIEKEKLKVLAPYENNTTKKDKEL